MGREGVLVDAGPLVALLSARDQHHQRCVDAAKSLRGPFYTCWPAVTEAAYLLRDQPSAVLRLLNRIRAGKLRLLDVGANDIEGIGQILERFADQRLDLADAILMHLAQREDLQHAFTVDRRHFSLFRLSDGRPLVVIP